MFVLFGSAAAGTSVNSLRLSLYLGVVLDLAAIFDIISSTFSAAYFSAARDTSAPLPRDALGAASDAFFRSRNVFHFSE